MTPRNTRTGDVLEQMVLPALSQGGYHYRRAVLIGERLGGTKHVLDVLAWNKAAQAFLISLKWQQVSGTAEQKVPFEVICLAEATLSSQPLLENVICHHCGQVFSAAKASVSGASPTAKAYLVLGGSGWKLRNFFTGGGLSRHLSHGHLVKILALEDFIALANVGKL